MRCAASALTEVATEEAAGGKTECISHLCHLTIGVPQHYLGLAHQCTVYPCFGRLTTDTLDNSAKIACGETEMVGIVVEGVRLLDMLIDQSDKTIEHLTTM